MGSVADHVTSAATILHRNKRVRVLRGVSLQTAPGLMRAASERYGGPCEAERAARVASSSKGLSRATVRAVPFGGAHGDVCVYRI